MNDYENENETKLRMPILHIDHVNLVVRDLGAMVAFYERTLGFVVTKRVTIRGAWVEQVVGLRGVEADVVYLDAPTPTPAPAPGSSGASRIELIKYRSPATLESPDQGAPNTLGLRHLAFKVEAIDATVEKLRAAGVRFFGDVQQVPDEQVTYAGGVRKRLVYFHDPEGNLLELCEYAATA